MQSGKQQNDFALTCLLDHRVIRVECLSLSINRMVKQSFKNIFICMPRKSFLHLFVKCCEQTESACLNTCIAVLHTGKRWFIICPVEETPTSSQETPSEGTTTQSPGSSAATQPADMSTARPAASRGDSSLNNSTILW